MFVSVVMCLPKSRLFTQVKSLLHSVPLKCAALLRKGQAWVTRGHELHKDISCCERGWTGKVGHLGWRMPSSVIPCYFVTNKTQIWPYSPDGINFRECNNHQLLIQSGKRKKWFQKLQKCSSHTLGMHPCLWGLSEHSPTGQYARWARWLPASRSNFRSTGRLRSGLDLPENLPSRAYLAYWIGRS